MESIQNLVPEIQKRISDFVRSLEHEGFSLPERKNISCLSTGMLKKCKIHGSELARSLGERIALKATWETVEPSYQQIWVT